MEPEKSSAREQKMVQKMEPEHYRQALEQVVSHFQRVEQGIRPVTILQNGEVGSVGVSDLDLILVFPDDFSDPDGFQKAWSDAIRPVAFRERLFVHHPMLLTRKAVRDLPRFTHNPASRMRVLMGEEPDWSAGHASPMQSVLISLEFMQFRIFQLVNQLLSENVTMRGVLLRGHSLVHSLQLAEAAGMETDRAAYKAFGIVETVRRSIHEGKRIELSDAEVTKLQKGIVGEFHHLYLEFCRWLERAVCFYLPDTDQYAYDNGAFMSNLFAETKKLNRKRGPGGVQLEGFHWANMLLRDLYFFPAGRDRCSWQVSRELEQECRARAEFHRRQWEWNRRVFGDIHAGLSPMPCVIGKQAEELAGNRWAVLSVPGQTDH